MSELSLKSDGVSCERVARRLKNQPKYNRLAHLAGLPPAIGRLLPVDVFVRLVRPLPERLPLFNVGAVVISVLFRVLQKEKVRRTLRNKLLFVPKRLKVSDGQKVVLEKMVRAKKAKLKQVVEVAKLLRVAQRAKVANGVKVFASASSRPSRYLTRVVPAKNAQPV